MPKKYKGKGTQRPYDEDFHFYRDYDPEKVAGSDPTGSNYNILRKVHVPGDHLRK